MKEQLTKFKSLSVEKANAEADIDLINRLAVKKLAPEDVYCFSVVLCDNEIDRDLERFSDNALKEFESLFVGKTGITDHAWKASNQFARLYRVQLDSTGKQTKDGRKLLNLVGSAYMVRNESNQPIIDNIEAGITKEVSVGVGVSGRSCSMCGKPFKFSWDAWNYVCEDGHVKGEVYDNKQCHVVLDHAVDAYEFSLVAVPAQPGAGITKGLEAKISAHKVLMEMSMDELASTPEANEALIKRLQMAQLTASERARRAELCKKYST